MAQQLKTSSGHAGASQDGRWLIPQWPAPARIHALCTLRQGGVSRVPYASFNLAAHVGDDANAVAANRERLINMADLPAMPLWLNQVHGTNIVEANDVDTGTEADACYTNTSSLICAVLTADCLPLLMCDRNGRTVCAVHAGWRGLAAGVIESAVAALDVNGRDILAWLGPAIGPDVFEVGDEVRQQFLKDDPAAQDAFRPSPGGRWLADIYRLARRRLMRQGVEKIYGGEWCTYSDTEHFYSYRRDGKTGRMASMIWIQND